MSVEIIVYGDFDKGTAESIRAANMKLARDVVAHAKSLCVEKTGQLKGSIMWKVPGEDGGHERGFKLKENVKKGEAIVGSATEYAQYVEFGTRFMDAQPYFRPAILLEVFGSKGENTMKKESVEAMKKALNEGKTKL